MYNHLHEVSQKFPALSRQILHNGTQSKEDDFWLDADAVMFTHLLVHELREAE